MPESRLVIADAGPLMALAKLNRLLLLKRLYGTIVVSQTVYDEVVTQGLARGYPDAATVKLFWEQQGWQPRAVQQGEMPRAIQQAGLDPGERESLTLAMREREALLLLDEEAGRVAARERNVHVKGTLGVLVEALQKGFIDLEEITLLFAQISQRDDIWINPELCQRILTELQAEQSKELRRKKSRRRKT